MATTIYDADIAYDVDLRYDGLTFAEFESALSKPTSSLVFLCELTAGKPITAWIQHAGTVYKTPCAQEVIELQIGLPGKSTSPRYALEPKTIPAAGVDSLSAGSPWYWDGSFLYIDTTKWSGANDLPFDNIILAIVKFHFSNTPKLFSNHFYDPRLTNIPNLSLRIESKFSGVGQIGGGDCSFANSDRYFDALAELNWEAGRATFKMGIDRPDIEMEFDSYRPLGVWGIEATTHDEKTFQVKLVELKTLLDRELPLETFKTAPAHDKDTSYWPNLSRNDQGKPVPLVYGYVYGVQPVATSPSEKKFKLAGHRIAGIIDVRKKNEDDTWTSIPFTADNALAEFTLGDEYTGNEDIVVDFKGKAYDSGAMIANPAHVVKDVIEETGETLLSVESFGTAASEMTLGEDDLGNPVYMMKPALYIDEKRKASDIISDINRATGSFLFINQDREWNYEVFAPEQAISDVDGASLPIFTERDFLRPLTRMADASELYSKITVYYNERKAEKWREYIEVEREENQYLRNSKIPLLREEEVPLWDAEDVRYYAERVLSTEGIPHVTFKCTVPWKAYFLLPGSKVRLIDSTIGVNTVAEVLEVRHNLSQAQMDLVLGAQRNWGDSFGFWVSGTTTGTADWDSSLGTSDKALAVQCDGYWLGEQSGTNFLENNMADSTDADSSLVSRFW